MCHQLRRICFGMSPLWLHKKIQKEKQLASCKGFFYYYFILFSPKVALFATLETKESCILWKCQAKKKTIATFFKCVFGNYQCEYCWQHAKDNDKIFWQLKSFVLKKLVTHKKIEVKNWFQLMLCGCTLCGECPCIATQCLPEVNMLVTLLITTKGEGPKFKPLEFTWDHGNK